MLEIIKKYRFYFYGIIIAALVLALYLTPNQEAQAADSLTVSAVRDLNIDKNGVRLQGNSTSLLGGSNINLTYIDNQYYRLSAGKDFKFVNTPKFTSIVAINGGYQQTDHGVNGFGIIPSINATYKITKSVGVNVGAEYWKGESKLKNFDGTVITAGIQGSF